MLLGLVNSNSHFALCGGWQFAAYTGHSSEADRNIVTHQVRTLKTHQKLPSNVLFFSITVDGNT